MERVRHSIKELLRAKISPNSFDVWIEPLTYAGIKDNCLILNCPNNFFATWVRDNYLSLIRDEMSKRGKDVSIKLIPLENISSQQDGQLHLPQFSPTQVPKPKLCNRFTFDQFVVGECNRFAHAACWALANGETNHSKIIYLQSSAGLGKSHLAQAVGHCMLTRHPRRRICYLTANDFTSQVVRAIKEDHVDSFKRQYCKECEVLMLEEVHCFAGRGRTQSELATAIDTLLDDNKTVIFTSNKLPRQIPNVNDHLRSRLSGGLIISINPPDRQTRRKILDKKARMYGVAIEDNVLDFLADNLHGDIRQIEATVVGLLAKTSLLHENTNLSLAKEVLKDIVGDPRPITLEDVTNVICKYFKVSTNELRSKSRKKMIAWPRQVAMYLARQYTENSLEAIGRQFNRDHATVLHSVNKITRQIEESGELKHQVKFLMDRLEGQAWQI